MIPGIYYKKLNYMTMYYKTPEKIVSGQNSKPDSGRVVIKDGDKIVFKLDDGGITLGNNLVFTPLNEKAISDIVKLEPPVVVITEDYDVFLVEQPYHIFEILEEIFPGKGLKLYLYELAIYGLFWNIDETKLPAEITQKYNFSFVDNYPELVKQVRYSREKPENPKEKPKDDKRDIITLTDVYFLLGVSDVTYEVDISDLFPDESGLVNQVTFKRNELCLYIDLDEYSYNGDFKKQVDELAENIEAILENKVKVRKVLQMGGRQ